MIGGQLRLPREWVSVLVVHGLFLESCPIATEMNKYSLLSAEVEQVCVRLLGLIRSFGLVLFV